MIKKKLLIKCEDVDIKDMYEQIVRRVVHCKYALISDEAEISDVLLYHFDSYTYDKREEFENYLVLANWKFLITIFPRFTVSNGNSQWYEFVRKRSYAAFFSPIYPPMLMGVLNEICEISPDKKQ